METSTVLARLLRDMEKYSAGYFVHFVATFLQPEVTFQHNLDIPVAANISSSTECQQLRFDDCDVPTPTAMRKHASTFISLCNTLVSMVPYERNSDTVTIRAVTEMIYLK